ncbi:sulfatase [Lentisphaera marina]|uniref:sulfatase n=1 Tax=Lentisphaera marina TaxID=1111041 RepID=UPI0023654E65|nr:sulfatase [Lentisphaera marina]MDD7987203.1 sulfatase [Lentisphaera marina]
MIFKKFFRKLLYIATLAFSLSIQGATDTPYNVLFIIADDLNDYVNGLGGHPQSKTPNLDQFAKTAVSFTNAFSNAGWCAPSRASLHTGIAPWHSGLAMKSISKHKGLKNNFTLSDYFKKNNYYSIGTGKTEHGVEHKNWTKHYYGPLYGPFWKNEDDSVGAHPNVKSPFADRGRVDGSFGILEAAPEKGLGEKAHWVSGPAEGSKMGTVWSKNINAKTEYDPKRGYMTPDKVNADLVKGWFEGEGDELKAPFYLNLGFVRPHTPMHAEQKHFDHFPIEDVQLTAGQLETIKNFKPLDDYSKLEKPYKKVHELYASYGDLTTAFKLYNQAYLASVHAADENIGRVLDALENSKYKDNTIVIITSDHGWHNGEHLQIGKNSTWEEACRIPLLIRVPGLAKRNSQCNVPVSLMDIYPTLVDLCRLKGKTYKKGGQPLSGHSLKPLLINPSKEKWDGDEIAVTAIMKQWISDKQQQTMSVEGIVEKSLKYSMRSKRYRFVYVSQDEMHLYDLKNDPIEKYDLAQKPEYKEVISKFKSKLKKMKGDKSNFVSI